MTDTAAPLAPDRLVTLGRIALESQRGDGADHAVLNPQWRQSIAAVPADDRDRVLQEAARLLPAGPKTQTAKAARTPSGPAGTAQELMQKCAGLELKLQTEGARYAELQQAFQREQAEHKEAVESLALQQKRIKELQDARTKLMEDLSRTEDQLRRQINDTEQATLKYEKLKSSRQAVGGQVTDQAEQINALKAENQRLREQVEATLRQRDHQTAAAEAVAQDAQARTADSALQLLWGRMQKEVPTIFLDTHVASTETFERACDALVELVRVFAALERHVHQMLRDLRQVGEEDDKLTRFYVILTKNPGLADTLRDYLVSGRGRGNFANLLRAVQAWARAFGSGLYKVIVQSPNLAAEQLNYRNWPIKGGMLSTEEANIGKYFKETAHRSIPEALGTRFRKQAGDMAYEDYNTLMRQQR